MAMFKYYQAIRPKFGDTRAVINVDEAYIKLTLSAHTMWEHGLVIDRGDDEYTIRIQVKEYVDISLYEAPTS